MEIVCLETVVMMSSVEMWHLSVCCRLATEKDACVFVSVSY